jgi:hypothetical protein
LRQPLGIKKTGDVKILPVARSNVESEKQIRGVFMRFELLALYAGPDQVMTVTSGLASLLGLLLIFWNKVVGIFFKVVRKFSRSATPAAVDAPKDSPKGTP